MNFKYSFSVNGVPKSFKATSNSTHVNFHLQTSFDISSSHADPAEKQELGFTPEASTMTEMLPIS